MKWVVLAAIATILATIKVNNELRMTEMYERQAVALESMAANRKVFVGAKSESDVIVCTVSNR